MIAVDRKQVAMNACATIATSLIMMNWSVALRVIFSNKCLPHA
jgi:hypothetical protein